jgi:hypothetical protein
LRVKNRTWKVREKNKIFPHSAIGKMNSVPLVREDENYVYKKQ